MDGWIFFMETMLNTPDDGLKLLDNKNELKLMEDNWPKIHTKARGWMFDGRRIVAKIPTAQKKRCAVGQILAQKVNPSRGLKKKP